MVFITVARLAPDKAFMRYLACIKKVIDELKGKADAEFWIIGDGTERFKMYKYLLADKCVELDYVESLSHMTVARVLKKRI